MASPEGLVWVFPRPLLLKELHRRHEDAKEKVGHLTSMTGDRPLISEGNNCSLKSLPCKGMRDLNVRRKGCSPFGIIRGRGQREIRSDAVQILR